MTRDETFLRNSYLKNLFPIMFSVLGGTINALIDSVFVSQFIGEYALAAVNMSMPVYLILCTIGAFVAKGGAVLSVREAGRSNMKEALSYYRIAVFLCAVSAVVMTALGLIFCRPVAELLSGGGALADLVYDYCFVSFIGTAATIGLYLPISYLHIDGKTRHISVVVILVVGVDTVCDLLFIKVFGWGLTGASAASVVSTLIACVYGFIALERGFSNYHFGFKIPSPAQLGAVAKFGSPVAFGNLFDAVKLILLNRIVYACGGDKASAVWAGINTLSELSIVLTSGIPLAAAPLIGAFFTSKENGGIRILIRLEAVTGIAATAGFTVAITLLNAPIKALFALSDDMLLPCFCLGVSTIFLVLCSIWDAYFNSAGAIAKSNIMVTMRKLVMPVAAAWVLYALGGYLWLFLPISGALTLLAGFVITAFTYYKKKKTPRYVSRFLLLDDYLERENKVLDFSIQPNMEAVCDASEQIKEFCAANNMSTKNTVKLGLSIEELLGVLISKNKNLSSVDLRAYAMNGTAGIRIRCAGVNYDPFNDKSSEDDFLMGINMIKKMADITEHTYTIGMNIINIIYPLDRK